MTTPMRMDSDAETAEIAAPSTRTVLYSTTGRAFEVRELPTEEGQALVGGAPIGVTVHLGPEYDALAVSLGHLLDRPPAGAGRR
jgi:hypothetical protein